MLQPNMGKKGPVNHRQKTTGFLVSHLGGGGIISARIAKIVAAMGEEDTISITTLEAYLRLAILEKEAGAATDDGPATKLLAKIFDEVDRILSGRTHWWNNKNNCPTGGMG